MDSTLVITCLIAVFACLLIQTVANIALITTMRKMLETYQGIMYQNNLMLSNMRNDTAWQNGVTDIELELEPQEEENG